MESKFKKHRLISPYNAEGKTNFNKRYQIGVYLIYKNNQLLYVGYSGYDLYKTMYRHFQDWSKSKQIRITYNADQVKVRVIYCNNVTTARRLETALIIKKKPQDNPQKLELYDTDEKENLVFDSYENTTEIKSSQEDFF